jgi:hypothetical protein
LIALALTILMAIQDPAVSRGGTVTGILRTAAGTPAPRVRVAATLVPSDPSDISTSALVSLSETDEHGRYALENIPPGRYYIVAGRVDRPTFYPGKLESASGTILEIVSRATIPGVDFVLDDASTNAPLPDSAPSLRRRPPVTIPVRVVVEEGRPLPVAAAGKTPTLQVAAADGSMSLEVPLNSTNITLPGGSEYDVRVVNLPDGYTMKSMTFNGTDLTSGTLKVPAPPPVRIVTLTGEGQLQQAIDQASQRVAAAASTLSITLSLSGSARD